MKILITEPEYFPEESKRILGTIGNVVTKRLTRSELSREVCDVDILIVRIETVIDKTIIDAAHKLKIIASATTGLNHIDGEYAKQRGIQLINLIGNHTTPAAEHTFALLLSLARKIPWAHAHVSSGKWERYKFFGVELDGKTLGLIGSGRIGSRVAQYAKAFGMKVLAFDPYMPKETAESAGIKLVSMEDILKTSDFVSIHAVLTDETRGMLGKREFEKMKPSAMIINTARAEIVNAADLVKTLENKRIAGAAFDVFEKEPAGSDDVLVKYAKTNGNLLLTPHLGASTNEAIDRASVWVAKEVVKVAKRNKTCA